MKRGRVYILRIFYIALIIMVSLPSLSNASNDSENPLWFSDVGPTHWAYDYIIWALSTNIIYGYEDGSFHPDQEVTEAEFLALLLRAKYPEEFKNVDKPEGKWYEPYYDFAKEMDWEFFDKKEESLTRIEVATMMAILDGEDYSNKDSVIDYVFSKKYANGREGTTSSFDPHSNVSRAESTVFTYNYLRYSN